MKGKFDKGFITLSDLYVAYRKAKLEAYHETTHFHALAFTEYEQELQKNLSKLYETINAQSPNWDAEPAFLGDYTYLPKSIDFSAWDNNTDGHFRAVNPISDWNQRFNESNKKATAKLRLVIRPTVNFQIISALWIMKVGHLFDGIIDSKVSYGNRLQRAYGETPDIRSPAPPFNLTVPRLFSPYFSAYRQWRENGLSKMEQSLSEGLNILAITMDIEQFYHRVSPNFLLRKPFLESIGLTLNKNEVAFTNALLGAIESWYRTTPDYLERPQGAIPVGLSASKIISNVLLAHFDNAVNDRVRPIYYGRYVDDIFLVFENNTGLSSAGQVTSWLCNALAPELQSQRNEGSSPSMRLDLPYAQDSELIFTGKKQKIFALSSRHGLDLIQHIRDQIRIQSSEYRLLPAIPSTGSEMASKALLAAPDATLQVDALRKADSVSVRRLGFSILLRDVESYSDDLKQESWSTIRDEFYGLVQRHILTPTGFFDFLGYIPRIFGLMLSCGDTVNAEGLISDLFELGELIKRTTTAGEQNQEEKFRLCLCNYAQALRQTGLQAATVRKLDLDRKYLNVLRQLKLLDPHIKVPSSVKSLQNRAHQILLADWGRRPYKDYWYLSQTEDEKGPPVPRKLEVRRKLRLGGIRRFRRLAMVELKMPHWPALTFPTRPLRFDEIAFVAPDVLSNPYIYRQAIMCLRGARVRPDSNFGIIKSSSSDEDNVLQFFTPGNRNSAVRIAITSYKTSESQWTAAAKGKPDRSALRYEQVNQLVNQILRERKRPDYIVFPELSVPLRWALRMARKLALNNVSLLAGVEYHADRSTGKLRNDCLISLATYWPGYLTNVIRLQPKFLPAHAEKENLKKIHGKDVFFEPKGALAMPTVYVHRGFCFSVLICSDLTNISHRHHLRGHIDALFALEWNCDIRTFSPLVESTANDLHAYIIQANNRLFGDSRIRAPAKEEYLRDIVQVKGGVSDYYVLGEVDFADLRREQNRKQKSPKFKPTPTGFVASAIRKRKL